MMQKAIAFAFGALLATSGAADAPAAQPSPPWTALGSPASQLRTSLGDPLRIVTFDNGNRRIARYWIPPLTSTYVLVIEERGYIIGFNVLTNEVPTDLLKTTPPDRSGVRLGETIAAVKAQHPEFRPGTDEDGNAYLMGKPVPDSVAVYTFQSGRLSAFQWGTKPPEGPQLQAIAEPAGRSPAEAILDLQKNESDGVAWEYLYLAFHRCADNQHWSMKSQSLLSVKGHPYDKTTCRLRPHRDGTRFLFRYRELLR
jgi:hypothetical protein